jgi:hypothetical protein
MSKIVSHSTHILLRPVKQNSVDDTGLCRGNLWYSVRVWPVSRVDGKYEYTLVIVNDM